MKFQKLPFYFTCKTNSIHSLFLQTSSLKPISNSSPLHTEENSNRMFVLVPSLGILHSKTSHSPSLTAGFNALRQQSLFRDLMTVFLKGFEYHIKHDLRAVITQYVVFILGFTCLSWVLLKCKSIILPQAFTFSSQNQQ